MLLSFVPARFLFSWFMKGPPVIAAPLICDFDGLGAPRAFSVSRLITGVSPLICYSSLAIARDSARGSDLVQISCSEKKQRQYGIMSTMLAQ